MNDLNAAIADLDQLALAYSNRARSNGPAHPHTNYLIQQATNFSDAAWALKQAVRAAKLQAAIDEHAPAFEVVGEITVEV